MSAFDIISWMNGVFFGGTIAAAFVITGYADIQPWGLATMALLYMATGMILQARMGE